jgi:copper(I)-binding protein
MSRAVPFALLALLAMACSEPAAPLVAAEVTIRPPMPGTQMTAGYLTLQNNSAEAVTITRVTSAQFGRVEMHETIIEDGVARMSELGEITLEPTSSIEFTPGGKHLMLMRPAGDLGTVSLDFYAGETVVLTVSVVPGE